MVNRKTSGNSTTRSKLTVWFLWYLAASFLFYEFLLRVSPSVMVESLMATFQTDAGMIGVVLGIYFYIYAPMQLPVGLLMDRFGPRKLLPAAALVCGVAGVLFGFVPDLTLLALARLMMGLGSAFAFVGLLYITSRWLPRDKMALLIGIANSAAMVGAIAGEGPISILEDYIGWRYVMDILGVMGILLALVLYFVIRRAPKQENSRQPKVRFSCAWKSLKEVLAHPLSWLNAIIGALIYTTTTAFASLWGVTFLIHNHHMNRDMAGFASSTLYLGWIFGGPLIGHLSDRLSRRRIFLKVSTLLAGIAFLPLALYTDLPHYSIFLLLFVVGFFSASELLNFSYAIDLHSIKGTGSAIAFTNLVIMLAGALFQPLVGVLLDLFWSGTTEHGVRVYSQGDYSLTMLVFPLTFFLAFVLAFFLKENKKHLHTS